MYTTNVPFKDLYDKPANQTVYFHLYEREVMKLLAELQYVFNTMESWQNEATRRTLDTPEVVEFYTKFEEIVLAAYGKPIDGGLGFDHSERYKFEDSSCFNQYMINCLTDTEEVGRLINGILPDGMADIAKMADENLIKAAKEADSETTQEEILRLRAQLAAATGAQNPETPSV